jgi:hypothetical protein
MKVAKEKNGSTQTDNTHLAADFSISGLKYVVLLLEMSLHFTVTSI